MFKTRIFLVLFTAAFTLPVWAENGILVEAAKQAEQYWNTRYNRCSNHDFGDVWYATIAEGPDARAVQAVLGLNLQFKTEALTEADRLNNVDFKVVTSIESKAYRWWTPNSGWGEWHSGESTPITLMKKNGQWSVVTPPNTQPDEKRALRCSQVPKS